MSRVVLDLASGLQPRGSTPFVICPFEEKQNDSDYRRKWDCWQSSAGESSAKRRKASRNVPFQRRGGKGPGGNGSDSCGFFGQGEPCGGAGRGGERLPGVRSDSGGVEDGKERDLA